MHCMRWPGKTLMLLQWIPFSCHLQRQVSLLGTQVWFKEWSEVDTQQRQRSILVCRVAITTRRLTFCSHLSQQGDAVQSENPNDPAANTGSLHSVQSRETNPARAVMSTKKSESCYLARFEIQDESLTQLHLDHNKVSWKFVVVQVFFL